MILAGIDEAGYGPTLGPLVVSATAFRIPDSKVPEEPEAGDAPFSPQWPDLWKLLAPAVAKKKTPGCLAVNDSKKLYQSGRGLGVLEETALAFLVALHGRFPADLRELLETLSGTKAAAQRLDEYPWYAGRNLDLPRLAYSNAIRSKASVLSAALAVSGVEVLGLRSVVIDVGEFNRAVDRLHSKSSVSFLAVGSLLERIWKTFPAERIDVVIDRQGGRMHYGPQLYGKLKPRGLRILDESENLSAYELVRSDAPSKPAMRVSFAVDSEERCLPVGLASLFCKLVRELHMMLFNNFWVERVETLRSTAGYAVDARRFLGDIAPKRRELEIDDEILIRKR